MVSKYLLTLIFLSVIIITPSRSQEQLLQHAKGFIEQKDFDQAIEIYVNILETDSGNVEVKIGLARVYSWNQQYNESLSLYNELIEDSPHSIELSLGKARVLAWAGRYEEAEKLLKKLISEHGYTQSIVKLFTTILKWQEKYDEIIQFIQDLLRQQTDNSLHWQLLSESYNNKGLFLKAKKAAKKAIILDSENSAARKLYSQITLFTFETRYLYEKLTIISDWTSQDFILSYKPFKGLTAVSILETAHRFDKEDILLNSGIYYTTSRQTNIYLNIGLAKEKNFFPNQRYDFEISRVLVKRFVGGAGLNLLNFKGNYVKVWRPFFTYYFQNPFFWDYVLFVGQTKKSTSYTHFLKINYLLEQHLHLYLGYSVGSDILGIRTFTQIEYMNVRTFIFNLRYWATNSLGIKIDAGYSIRKNSWTRKSFGLGLFYHF